MRERIIMKKYHIGKNGPAVCRAEKGECPYGGETGVEEHYETFEEAQEVFEEMMENTIGTFATVKRKMTWEEHEKWNYEQFKKHYSDLATFKHDGGSDSNVSDILVKTPKKDFFVEVKSASGAASGQFVTTLDGGKYIPSKKNVHETSPITERIIKEINNRFEKFSVIGSKGIDLRFSGDTKIYTDWIKQHYKEKNAEFIAMQMEGEQVVMPLKSFEQNFDVRAEIRGKTSGTSPVAQQYRRGVTEYLENHGIKPYIESDRMYISPTQKIENRYFTTAGKNFFIGNVRDGKREIRKRSETKNPTVIFYVKPKEPKEKLETVDFRKVLEDLQ